MKTILIICWQLFAVAMLNAQALYELPAGVQSRLSSFENLNGLKANGGKSNKGAKGNAFEMVEPGTVKTLLNVKGEGTITRIWLTVNNSTAMLRSLRLQMFWEGETKPAVDVPMGDFFLHNLGRNIPFQTALFTSAEGRSYNCYIPMPFKKQARVVLINEGNEAAKLYFDISVLMQPLPATIGYFHCYWSRQKNRVLGADLQVLPRINGRGRFIGLSAGLHTDSVYDRTWWGEGEVKMYIDDDSSYASWVGTGAEDYLGSAWGLGTFNNLYQGCTIASEKDREFEFYRFHIPDPVYFKKNIAVTWQQIGGGDSKLVQELMDKGVRLKPVTIDGKSFTRLLDEPGDRQKTLTEGWVNFYRGDDYGITAYFYLNKPLNNLPALAAVAQRLQ